MLSKANEGDVLDAESRGVLPVACLPKRNRGCPLVQGSGEAGLLQRLLRLADCGRENENWAEEEKYLTKAAEMNDPAALLRLAIETLEVPYDRRTHKAHMRKGTSLLLRAADLGSGRRTPIS